MSWTSFFPPCCVLKSNVPSLTRLERLDRASFLVWSFLCLVSFRSFWNWRRGRKGNRLPATTERKQPSNRVDWLAANQIHHLPGRLSKRKPLDQQKVQSILTLRLDLGTQVLSFDTIGRASQSWARESQKPDEKWKPGVPTGVVLCCVALCCEDNQIINSRSSSLSISRPNHSGSSKARTCYFPRIIFPRLAALPRLVPGNKVGRPHLARQISCAAIEFPPTFQGPSIPLSMSSISVLLLVVVPQLVPNQQPSLKSLSPRVL